MLVSDVADSSKALAPVPDKATVIAPVAAAAVLVTVKVCAAGAAAYPTVAPVKVCVPVGLSEIAGATGTGVVTGGVVTGGLTPPPCGLTVTLGLAGSGLPVPRKKLGLGG